MKSINNNQMVGPKIPLVWPVLDSNWKRIIVSDTTVLLSTMVSHCYFTVSLVININFSLVLLDTGYWQWFHIFHWYWDKQQFSDTNISGFWFTPCWSTNPKYPQVWHSCCVLVDLEQLLRLNVSNNPAGVVSITALLWFRVS